MEEQVAINFSLADILSLIALILGLLYSFQVFTLKTKSKAKNFFTFYLLNITFIILFYFLLRIKMNFVIKFFVPVLIFSILMMPVNLWIYQKKLTLISEKKSNLKHYLTPIVISSIVFILMFIVFVFSQKQVLAILTYFVMLTMTVGFLALNIIYITLSFLALKRHQKNVQNYFSYSERVDLNWVKVMIYGYVFLVLGLISTEIIKGKISDVIFYSVLILYILYIGNKAMRQKEISLDSRRNVSNEENNEEESELVTDEVFTESQLQLFQELKSKLKEFMETEKPFIDQDLTIFKLSKDLSTNTKYLSHVINSEFKQNFINFINEYRVEEVKTHLLSNSSNYTIETLAQNSGFKSKSSFNSAFKKVTGQTPSSFMKANLN
ncbi:MAG: helix-turn-helix domain-containing protein [Bacteroidota bacterium]